MLCKCIKDLEEKLRETDYHEASCQNISFAINGNKMETALMIPFSYRKKKKDGTFAKGKSSIDVRATFCPYCGKNQKKESL